MIASAIQLSAHHIVDAKKSKNGKGKNGGGKNGGNGKNGGGGNGGNGKNGGGGGGNKINSPRDIGYFTGRNYRNKSAIEKLNDLW